MREEPFEVTVGDGVLRGHRGGEGPPALTLHGGPAVPDYTEGLAEELDGLFDTIRYTQRGTQPSSVGPPFSIESHVADAVAVLDALGIDQAYAVGHSWGGHLALHLLTSHPERLRGLVCVDALGAFGDALAEMSNAQQRLLTPEQVERIEEIEVRRRLGAVTESDLVERWELIWPLFFADPESATLSPRHVGVECSIGTNASIAHHFERGTLEGALPDSALPVLFVHGEQDPLPVRSSTETAALIPGGRVVTIPRCGHFPWVERPGEVRRAVEENLAFLGAGSSVSDT